VKIDQENDCECTQIDRYTDANWFHNLSNGICYSYGADNNGMKRRLKCDVCLFNDDFIIPPPTVVAGGIIFYC